MTEQPAPPEPTEQERRERAYDDGYASALRGEEAAPGCTVTPEGRSFLRGYIDGAQARRAATAPGA